MDLIAVFVGKLKATASKRFLYPDTDLKKLNRVHDEPDLSETIATAVKQAKDYGPGAFIEKFGKPARKENGPWSFSKEAHSRHGVER